MCDKACHSAGHYWDCSSSWYPISKSIHCKILGAVSMLQQLERLGSQDTPAASWLPILLSHIGSQVKRRQSQSYKIKEFAKFFEFWNKHYTWHTFWSCLIRCANMKWIQWVLLKIQSVHDSVHRQTARQGETKIIKMLSYQYRDSHDEDKTHNHLIFIRETPISGKTVFILRQGPKQHVPLMQMISYIKLQMLVFLSRTKWSNKNQFHLISSEGVAPLCKCHRIIKLMGKVLRKGYICKHKLVLYEIPKSTIVYWFVMKT